MDNETTVRLSFFFGILAIVGVWEVLFPRRKLLASKLIRWSSNLGIVFLNSILVRAIFPLTALAFSDLVQQKGWGIFNHLSIPEPLSFGLSLVFLDAIIYWQHVLFHRISFLWRFHRMHHADVDFDVTNGARFHPIEILISMGIKFGAILAIGASAKAVFVFEILLNGTAMFNHGNIKLPLKIDQFLRKFLVTPDMHRIHHSIIPEETHSNFGFNLPWWDHLFRTYRAQPKDGHQGMTIGLPNFRNKKFLNISWLLAIPFLKKDEP